MLHLAAGAGSSLGGEHALHRYASDAAVIAVALHVLRLIVQGKTWGPRALAWVTGVLLAGMMLLSAGTGFVPSYDEGSFVQ